MKAPAALLALFCTLSETATSHAAILATASSPADAFPPIPVVLDAIAQPSAVANFMGLVDGSLPWLDPADGRTRGGAGDAFHDGMVFDWNTGDMLRGGLRGVEQADGSLSYIAGPGYTVLGKTNAPWSNFPFGALALVEGEGPHSGGSEVAFALTNTTTAWTVFGRAESGAEESLRALAALVKESGPTEVRWKLDASGMTDAERTALESARANLPDVKGIATRVETGNAIRFEWPGYSQLHITRWEDLLGSALYVVGGWNENAGTRSMSIGWPDVYLTGPKGFLALSCVRYPLFAPNPFTGKWRMAAAHTGQLIQYWFDFDGRTGMMARVESGEIKESAVFSQLESWRTGANTITVYYGRGFIANYYHLGFAVPDARSGRFLSEQKVGEETTDWGLFELAEGWDDGKTATTGSTSKKAASTPRWLPWSAGPGPCQTNILRLPRAPRQMDSDASTRPTALLP